MRRRCINLTAEFDAPKAVFLDPDSAGHALFRDFWHIADVQPDRVARSGSGLKADMPNQRVKCPLITQSWVHWLRDHAQPGTRVLHFLGKLTVRLEVFGGPPLDFSCR